MGGCEYEFDGFALQPGSAVFESLDAAGVDCRAPGCGVPGCPEAMEAGDHVH